MIKNLIQFENEILDFHKSGIQRGEYVGFKSLEALYTKKKGSMTFILASPHSGKTEFNLEILLNLSLKYGEKHVIFSPETGDYKDLAKELISKYIRKPFFASDINACSESEIYNAIAFLSDKFYIVDNDENSFTFDDIISQVKVLEAENRIKIDNILFDPYNEVKHNMSEFGSRQDLYIEDAVGKLRRYAKKENKHVFICMHPQDQQPITENGVTYYPPPHPRQSAGGQSFFRKAMAFIILWRPPFGFNDKDGQPYKENETHVIIAKAKPKGSAKLGTCKLFWDWKKNRFYEEIEGVIYFGLEYEAKEKLNKEPGNISVLNSTFGKDFEF
jgi:thymidine kinase